MASLYRTKRARAGISVLYGRLCSRTYWLAWSRDSVTPSVLRLALLDWRAGTVKPYAQPTDCPNATIAADGLIVAVNGNEVRLTEPGGGQPAARLALPAKIEPWTLAISPDRRLILGGDIQGGVHILHTPPA